MDRPGRPQAGLRAENIQFKGLGFGLLPLALQKGRCDVADIFQTDPSYAQYHFVPLKDTKNIFGFQNVAPVVSAKLLKAEGPAFAKTLNRVSALLTQQAMIKMNEAVVVNKISPAGGGQGVPEGERPVVTGLLGSGISQMTTG